MSSLKTYYKKQLAQALAPCFDMFQINRMVKPFYGGVGHILMLHRVVPSGNEPRIHNHLSLEITPKHLDNILGYLSNAGYDFISIEEVPDRLKVKSKKRFIVVTFDDGYNDNLQYALPVFEKYAVPFTIYLCNDFPDNKIFLWWYMLEDVLLRNNELAFSADGEHYSFDSSTKLKKEKVFNKIRKRKNDGHISDQALKSLFQNQGIDTDNYPNDKVLQWNEIKKLAAHPLVTIGAHTASHSSLKTLKEEELLHEVRDAKMKLEEAIGKPVDHIAYPFGSPAEVGRREIELVRKLGFETAVTTSLGNIHPVHIGQLHCLPRISINSLTSISVLKAQLSGVIPMVENKFKRSTLEKFL